MARSPPLPGAESPGWQAVLSTILLHIVKWLAGCGVHGCSTREQLPPPDRDVDVLRADLDQPGSAACSLGRDQGRASAAEGIENDALPVRTVPDCIGHEGYRLDRPRYGSRPAAHRSPPFRT